MDAEKISSMTTPVARKAHICSICGKPIQKGEQYFNTSYKVGRKIMNRKAHYSCHEGKKMTEDEFKKTIGADMMMEVFSFQENMEIAFIPLIITEVARNYADKVTQAAARDRIPQTIKLSRDVKTLHKAYDEEVAKDLDNKHQEHFKGRTQEFIQECSRDLLILWFSVSKQLKKSWSKLPCLDMRTDAFVCIVMCELLKQHNKRMADLIGERTGYYKEYTNPKIEALRECMEAYVSPAEIDFSIHVKTSLKIMQKHLSRIKFNLTQQRHHG